MTIVDADIINNQGLPVVYRSGGERTIASYDYTDIAEGTGIVTLYLYNTIETTTKTYLLSKNAFYSNNVETATGISGVYNNYTQLVDTDFNLSAFNLPKTIGGTATMTVSWALNNYHANSKAATGYLIVRVRKYSGTTETEIAYTTSPTISVTDNINTTTSRNTLKMTIPKTNFKRGDILRVTIEGWFKNTAAEVSALCNFVIAHDPMNTDGAIITVANTKLTTTKIDIPFRIDL